MRHTKPIVIILLGLLSLPLAASDLGGYTGASLRLAPDAISAGNGGITLFESTSSVSLLSNPAAASWSTGRRLSANLVNLSLDRYLYAAGLELPLPPTAHLGVAVVAAGTSDIDARDNRGYYAGKLNDSETFVIASFANRLARRFAVGVTLKMVNRHLGVADEDWLDLTAKGFGVNVGLLWKATTSGQLALAIRDLNTSYNWKTQDYFPQGSSYRDVFPANLAWGWQQQLGDWTLSSEHAIYFIGEQIGRMAVNWQGLELLELRLGLQLDADGLRAGGGGSLRVPWQKGPPMRLDLGMIPGVSGEGMRTYLGWTLTF